MERRKFTRELKLEAVRLIKERGVSYMSGGAGVHPTQPRNWVKAFAGDPQHVFPGQGQIKPEQLEIARLLCWTVQGNPGILVRWMPGFASPLACPSRALH
jgi:transposase